MPVPPNPLIGRSEEIATAIAMLRDPARRLLTLTGAGGSGKTRLALAAADTVAGDFADGVVFVDLAPVRDPALVAAAVATALGLREGGAQSIADQLAAYSARARDAAGPR